jgi:hypothetical protein
MSTEPRRPFGETWTGRLLISVAIVWSIAGAFVALEIGLPELFGRAVAAGAVSDRMVMSGGLNADSSTHCGPSSAPENPPAPNALRDARYFAWRLGHEIGWSAGLANAGQSDEASARSLAQWQAMAGNVGIPAPLVPRVRHAAKAMGEFELHIESDPQCTAARLSQIYGKRHGSTFKLGAYVGYAALLRMAVPDAPAVFVPYIRHYGEAAGVPQELLQPLLQDALDGVPGATTHEKIVAIRNRLDEYFKTSN